jgi:hypothetical protein
LNSHFSLNWAGLSKLGTKEDPLHFDERIKGLMKCLLESISIVIKWKREEIGREGLLKDYTVLKSLNHLLKEVNTTSKGK